MGHSWGANASFEAAASDPTIDALVPIAATRIWASTLQAISAPTLMLSGGLDCMAHPPEAPADFAENYERLPEATDRELVTIAGANHVGFTIPNPVFGLVAAQLGDCERTIHVVDHQHRLARRYATAWFEVFLKGRTEFETYLTGDQAHQDVADGRFVDFRYAIDGSDFESGEP